MTDRARETTALRWGFRGVVVAVVGIGLAIAVRERFQLEGATTFSLFDDAMISMRYGRNLAQGHGLVWNPGDAHPVEGYTNLSWTLWMAALHLTPMPDRLVSLAVVVSGLALVVGLLFGVRALARLLVSSPRWPSDRPAPAWVPFVAVVFTATSAGLLFWTARGMEVPLVAALGIAGLVVVARMAEAPSTRKLVLLSGVIVALLISRPDTAPIVAVLALAAVVVVPADQRRRCVVVLVVVGVATLAALTAFRLAYYGAALPNTYTLKMTGSPVSRRLLGGTRALRQDLIVYLAPPLILGAAALCDRANRRRPLVWALAGMVVGQLAYAWWVGGDAWEHEPFVNRYVGVVVPELAILMALGVAALVAGSTSTRRAALVVMGTGSALWCAAVLASTDPSVFYSQIADLDRLRPLFVAGLVAGGAVATYALAAPRWRRPSGTDDGAPRLSGRQAAAWAAVLVVGMTLVTTQQAARSWWTSGASLASCDTATAKVGAAERAATDPDAVIAVWWAGNGPYFSDRPSLDVLGKSDRHIASLTTYPNQPFHPGHDKIDLEYSINQLRPDVVDLGAVVFGTISPDDLARYADWGYTAVTPSLLVRDDSTKVDRAKLAQTITPVCAGG